MCVRYWAECFITSSLSFVTPLPGQASTRATVQLGQDFSQPPAWGARELWGAPGEASVPSGKTALTPHLDTMRPDSLLKMTLGAMTLTLLETSAPSSGPPDLTTHFFAEFDAVKDGPFSSRDFHHLRLRFQRACPCSHVRYKPKAGA